MKYRAIFLSDLHLGMRGCSATRILEFLHTTDSDYLFLVGDIIDGWALRRSWYWPSDHNLIVQKVLAKARKGTRVIFLPGNHDELARQLDGLALGGIEIHLEYLHRCLDGRVLLVLHGDQYDLITLNHKWLSRIGDVGYVAMLALHRFTCWLRGQTGRPYWSLSNFLKSNVKKAVSIISQFEKVVAESCADRADGVICGHIHHAQIRQFDNLTYYNCGDGVESCTALVETLMGEMQILDYHFSPPVVIADGGRND